MINNPERCTDLFVVVFKLEDGSESILTLFEFRNPYWKMDRPLQCSPSDSIMVSPAHYSFRWYFIETSWSPESGAELLIDQQSVDRNQRPETIQPSEGDAHFLIGRANTDMRRERYADAKVCCSLLCSMYVVLKFCHVQPDSSLVHVKFSVGIFLKNYIDFNNYGFLFFQFI